MNFQIAKYDVRDCSKFTRPRTVKEVLLPKRVYIYILVDIDYSTHSTAHKKTRFLPRLEIIGFDEKAGKT